MINLRALLLEDNILESKIAAQVETVFYLL